MNKRLFTLLVILMSLSLIGIIFVQAYYITNALETKEEQFTFNVKKALTYTTNQVADIEYKKYVKALNKIISDGKEPDTTAIRNITVYKQDNTTNQIIIYNTGILEENFKVPSLIDLNIDSLGLSNFRGKTTTKIYDNNILGGDLISTTEQSFEKVLNMDKLQKATFESQYNSEIKNTPIHQRVSVKEIQKLLSKKLREDVIDIDFEFAIFHHDLGTKIQSPNFVQSLTPTIGAPIFLDDNDESDFKLFINFPERKKFIISSIIGVTLLSVLFTLIIIIAYTSALYQLIKQRKISQMKSDFINNMTHEFKTPIATINLALDAIKNPKIINDQEKVKRYLRMIKEENKRMNAQVENVLRISQLQKKQLNISKERLKLHDLIEDAITHVELIVEDRNGYINTHFNAPKSSVLANETYFTNVIVNVLDNAIKYSDNAPNIDVYTENIGNNIILSIKDQGKGMNKAVQKRIFEEFYREYTGDVHNVKGHGLGLANVKRIVENHQGIVSVDSEKGRGSTFIIKLPLIA
ncbi:MAG: Signal-transduction histidine kinase senX3 [Formosa sp. Hel1_33_131]|nr:MAG: Signal-transduction histidine kinase senX3 [Formosa sp. Hel1_33_131]|tara:strand:+ start:2657 stop:4225 length:1569 start_codon:yes stop_codon:yes gene_type:complete